MSAGSPVFSCIGDLLAYHSRTAPERDAILAPGRTPMTYRALWASAKDTLRGLRSLGVSRGDRVAVALPAGPETAVTMISIASSAVCVPLNPAFTADECQRYFAELRVAALLTRIDLNPASRAAALALGIPVVDMPTSPRGGFGPFEIEGRTNGHISDDDFASGADDAFILL